MNDEVLEAQRIARKDRKIRFAGGSFHGGHAEMIPAMTKLDHLDQDIRAVSALLEEICPLYPRMGTSCEGVCPKELPVADTLRFLRYSEGYGQFSLGRENYQSLAPELPEVRCADGGQCAVKRPNGVKVAQRLIRAQEMFG